MTGLPAPLTFGDVAQWETFFIMQLKPFLSFEKQVESIQKKGISIDNYDECLAFLKKVNYYRFSAYYLPFKQNSDAKGSLSFSKLKRVYEFDGKLRALLFPVIEKIEIKLRTVIANYFSSKYGAEGYLDSANFSAKHNAVEFGKRVKSCIHDQRKTLVVKHHIEKYGGRFPLWVIIEYFSMGMLSYFYSDMKREDKKAIASILQYPSDQKLECWLRCLTDLRNICAHYSRIYYLIFTAIPVLPKHEKIKPDNERTLYPQLRMLYYLLNDYYSWLSDLFVPLRNLIYEYKDDINILLMGFPESWPFPS